MAASTVLHLIVLVGITFTLPQVQKLRNISQPLEVVLVNTRTKTKPSKADALAQANLDGGGNTDAKRRAKNPLPVLPKETRNLQVEQAAKKVQELEREARALMTAVKAEQKVNPPEPKADAREQPADDQKGKDIVARSLEIARLQAQIDREWDAYQKRPRRTFVGARAQSYDLAQYVEDWRHKIERVGTLNFPEAARQQKLFGSLQLTVAIKIDGSVESVVIDRPSGKKILDQAALRIVELAGPFAPLPTALRKNTDILHITRTWTFTRSDEFISD
ncbi:MAG TPA: TonB family protein [Burkholderiales bacterium]